MASKNEDILNACGHRNSERVKALKELPSAVCPACLLERIKELEVKLKQRHWIPVIESLPKEGKCLVLCEGKVYEVKVRISEDEEWEDSSGKSFRQETAFCDIRGLGSILIGHDECITHWKPIVLPEQTLKEK